jgi:hypothetical protein
MRTPNLIFREFIQKSSTNKLVGICWVIGCLFVFAISFCPLGNETAVNIGRILFIIASLFFGLGGVPIIIRKQYPFLVKNKFTEMYSVISGWTVLCAGIFMAGAIFSTFFH